MSAQTSRRLYALVGAALLVLAGGCAVTLVQPYDERLVTDTEALFKKASAMIDRGIARSPRTDDDRKKIEKPEDHPAHFSKFEADYRALGVDADALILRALSKSRDIGPLGSELHKKIEQLIDKELPTQCPEIKAELGDSESSLTVWNYIDLKCILIRWEDQHSDPDFTQDKLVLKRTNWELRRSAIFSATLAIQRSETSKKR